MRFFDLAGNAGGAEFSLWQTSGGGTPPKVWMSTADGGITSDDVFYVLEGGHAHANWGFSEAGYYQIDFRFSGVLSGTMETVQTPVKTWHFGVEHQPEAIPEPSAFALLALAGAAAMLLGRRLGSRFTEFPEQTKNPKRKKPDS